MGRAAQKGQQWQRRCQEIYLKKPSQQEISLRNFMPGNLGLTNQEIFEDKLGLSCAKLSTSSSG
jgi:hypothetical protein